MPITKGRYTYKPTNSEFPNDLSNIGHWVEFRSFGYKRAGRRKIAERGPVTSTVRLPMPANLGTDYNAEYNNPELGVPGSGARSLATTARQEYDTPSGKSIIDHIKDIGIKAKGNVGGFLAGQALDTLSNGGFQQGAEIGFGITRNPHLAVMYRGSTFRKHSFDYEMIARDSDESDAIREIIKAFKLAQAVDYESGFNNHLFRYPDEWEIKFKNAGYLYNPGVCVLENIKINYHGSGQAIYFQENAAPVHVSLGLEFQEVNIVTKDDIGTKGR